MHTIAVSINKDISTQEMTAKLLELEQMVKNISEFSQEFCIKPLYGKLLHTCMICIRDRTVVHARPVQVHMYILYSLYLLVVKKYSK